MEITLDLIFMLVQAVLTGILGAFMKDNVIPARFVPIQNIVIGIVSAFIAIYFGLFNNIPTAIFICLAVSLGVGGGYDAIQTKNK